MSTSPNAASENWTVRKILEWTTGHLKKHGSETARLDSEVLLAHAFGCARIQLYTRFDEVVPDPVRSQMREMVQRRAQREPVAYLVGYREFFSLRFEVSRDVLIPRPDTETLVMEAISKAKTIEKPRILEIGTGSGCAIISVAKQVPNAECVAVDLCPKALEIAIRNAATHGVSGRIDFRASNLFSKIPSEQKFDLILSNPPYIPTQEIPDLQADVARFEPKLALDGGPSGLEIIREIFRLCPAHLTESGWLLVEFSPEQAATISTIVGEGDWLNSRIHKDLSGNARVVECQKGPK